MQFMMIWTTSPDKINRTLERFGQTGALPPEGVTLQARWFEMGGGRGFMLAETDDPVTLASWCRQWGDLISFEVVPVIDDEQLKAAFAALR